jgi:DNA-binding HxlR family transcriptional regulator
MENRFPPPMGWTASTLRMTLTGVSNRQGLGDRSYSRLLGHWGRAARAVCRTSGRPGMSVARFAAEPMNEAILRASPVRNLRARSDNGAASLVRLRTLAGFSGGEQPWHAARGIGNKPEESGYRFQGTSLSITCLLQARLVISHVHGKSKLKRRSGCPVSVSLEIFGDRWSLLVIRDLMVRGFRTFREFLESGEGIATNILADRLKKLEAAGIVTAEVEETDGRKINYRLTEKGIDLAPVLLDLLTWGARHEQTGAPCALIVQMEENRDAFLAEVRRRWQERDLTPLIPKFGNDGAGGTGHSAPRKAGND